MKSLCLFECQYVIFTIKILVLQSLNVVRMFVEFNVKL